jgi:hypothetical protein
MELHLFSSHSVIATDNDRRKGEHLDSGKEEAE